MSTYSFDSISINGREIKLDHILQGTTVPLSNFEASTFLFIQKWFGDADDFIQKTSGSTGTAKSILIARYQMIASAELTSKALGLTAGENTLLCLDPEYIAGKMMMVRSFITKPVPPLRSVLWRKPHGFSTSTASRGTICGEKTLRRER